MFQIPKFIAMTASFGVFSGTSMVQVPAVEKSCYPLHRVDEDETNPVVKRHEPDAERLQDGNTIPESTVVVPEVIDREARDAQNIALGLHVMLSAMLQAHHGLLTKLVTKVLLQLKRLLVKNLIKLQKQIFLDVPIQVRRLQALA